MSLPRGRTSLFPSEKLPPVLRAAEEQQELRMKLVALQEEHAKYKQKMLTEIGSLQKKAHEPGAGKDLALSLKERQTTFKESESSYEAKHSKLFAKWREAHQKYMRLAHKESDKLRDSREQEQLATIRKAKRGGPSR